MVRRRDRQRDEHEWLHDRPAVADRLIEKARQRASFGPVADQQAIRNADITQGVRVTRIDRQRALAIGDGVPVTFEFRQGVRPVVQRIGVVRPRSASAASIGGDRVLTTAEPV